MTWFFFHICANREKVKFRFFQFCALFRKFCKTNEVEDEIYLLFECSMYSELRETFLNKLRTLNITVTKDLKDIPILFTSGNNEFNNLCSQLHSQMFHRKRKREMKKEEWSSLMLVLLLLNILSCYYYYYFYSTLLYSTLLYSTLLYSTQHNSNLQK